MIARSSVISPASGVSSPEARVAESDWQALAGELDNYGCAVLPKLLSREECRAIANHPLVAVAPFLPHRVALIQTVLPGTKPSMLDATVATTAEGVETLDQLHHVRQEGCTEVQGYFFSAPQPADMLRKYFARGAGQTRAA